VIDVGEKHILFISPRAMKKFVKEPAKAARTYTCHLILNQTCPRVQKMSKSTLKEIRESLMMSKAELSRKANISDKTIARIENGMPCRMETKRKIILALGFKISEKNKVFGDIIESSIKDNGCRRSSVDRRQFKYAAYIPEQRSNKERRNELDGRLKPRISK
jgi:DNA-binding XRE family transcriptional regulator